MNIVYKNLKCSLQWNIYYTNNGCLVQVTVIKIILIVMEQRLNLIISGHIY